jgi:two-component system chemotaxis response regulator CheY
MKLLIVEDDKVASRMFAKLLSGYGECETAFDGASAIDKYLAAVNQGAPYDVLLLDISLPEVDGQEVLVRIRDDESKRGIPVSAQVPVIMVTGQGDIENILTAHVSGCVAYLTKPIGKDALVRELQQLGLIE